VLVLQPGPAGTVTGTIASDMGGRNSGPGGNPQPPVEIRDGKFDGTRLTFSSWDMDRYTNRFQYEGVLQGNVLKLTISHQTPTGIEQIEASASRVP
jgi:hypothetical protein